MQIQRSAFVAFLLTLGIGDAQAFCIKTTCESSPLPEGCVGTVDAKGCSNEGKLVQWASPCLSFSVQHGGSLADGISADQLEKLVGNAFHAWRTVPCPGGGTPRLWVVTYPQSSCDEVGYRIDGPNQNLWVFRDRTWEHEVATDGALALTTLSVNPSTGVIYDADVELNAVQNHFTLSEEQVVTDLYSIVLHEAGHVLGIGHSEWSTSTMSDAYLTGSLDNRSLEADDQSAICSLMPPGELPTHCDPEPRQGFSPYCERPQPGCCSMTRDATPSHRVLPWTFGLIALLFSRRRITRRRTAWQRQSRSSIVGSQPKVVPSNPQSRPVASANSM